MLLEDKSIHLLVHKHINRYLPVSQFAPGTGIVHSSSVKTLSASVVVGERGGEGANLLGAS